MGYRIHLIDNDSDSRNELVKGYTGQGTGLTLDMVRRIIEKIQEKLEASLNAIGEEKEINLYDLILVNNSYSNTSYGKNLGYDINYVTSSERINEIIEETAKNNGIDIIKGNIHNTDTFYNNNYEEFLKYNCLGVEMESYALFVNAKILNKEAAVILTVSDNLITKKEISSIEREKSTVTMIQLVLDAIQKL